MKIIDNKNELKLMVNDYLKNNKTIGLVPTMGFLHKGHLSLVKESVTNNDVTIMTIFVNPTQFGPLEDLDSYPRDFERDSKLASEVGVTILFCPSNEEMYLSDYNTYVNVFGVTEMMCGESRQGHFRGVASVVSKLFNICKPTRAYFGKKDYQQLVVIRKMVRDLDFDIEIIGCPIVREVDGLAMSSRNAYLSFDERRQATILYKALMSAKSLFEGGMKSKEKLLMAIENTIKLSKLADVEYIEIRDAETLEEVINIDKDAVIALAVRFGKTRLIDNMVLEV